jgi:ubiquinone/menaquinone biosynthesis C-methylase UbiE
VLARERVEREGLKNVDYVTGDAVTLPLESNSIDVAFLVSVLGEVEQPQVALREILRVLRPGGTLSLTEHRISDPHALPKRELVRTAEAAGFRKAAEYGRWLSYTVNFRA